MKTVWSYGEERKRGLGEEKHEYGGGGFKARGRSGWKGLKNDMKGLGLASTDAQDPHAWRRKTVRDTC